MTCSFNKRLSLQVTSPKTELTFLISRVLKDIKLHRMLSRNWWAQVNQDKDWIIHSSRHWVIFRCKITVEGRPPPSKTKLSDNLHKFRRSPTLIAKTFFSPFLQGKDILMWTRGLWITLRELSRDSVLSQTPLLVLTPTSVFLNALTTWIAKMPNSRIWKISFVCLISIRMVHQELHVRSSRPFRHHRWRRQLNPIFTDVLNTSTQTTEWP